MVTSRNVWRPDMVVHSSDSVVQLVVEVKGLADKTDEWAATFRRNLMVHGRIPASRFFLLAMADYFYLWRDLSLHFEKPDYKVPTAEVLKPYLQSKYLKDLSVRELSGQGLELLVESWLGSIISPLFSEGSAEPEDYWLFESGLYESIKDGYFEIEPSFE